MGRCDGCEYEYDGICTALGVECNAIAVCNVITNKLKEEILKTPTIGKGETKMEKKNKECNGCFGASMNDCGSCEKETKQDNVNHPKHYEGHCSIECIDNMRLIFGSQIVAEYCMVNAYKYLSRHKYKNGYEDLCKAKWYLDKAEELELTEKATIDNVVVDELGELCREYMEGYKHGKGNE